MAETRKITKLELEQHKTDGDLWVAISGKVYDLSKFCTKHPGGANIIEENAGKEVT